MALLTALDVAEYALVPVDGGTRRQGMLLRARWDDGVVGYGDVHPWPELGDATLRENVASLVGGAPLPLARRALELAREDGLARSDGRSLFDGVRVPKSHATIVRAETLSSARLAALEAFGFDTLKIKVSPENLATVVEVATSLPDGWRIRLDANARFDRSNVAKLLSAIDRLADRLDFVEDPTAWGDEWPSLDARRSVSWASDWVRSVDPDVVVLKTNVRSPLVAIREGEWMPDRWVVTSALDHPVGQAFAAWEAGRAQAKYADWIDTCGLATHLVYQQNSFSERLSVHDGRLVVASGRGIGFDDLWPALPWTSLRSA